VRRNAANENLDDGIEVANARATIARNRANENGDLGIEAVAGVTGGGGNAAGSTATPLSARTSSARRQLDNRRTPLHSGVRRNQTRAASGTEVRIGQHRLAVSARR
jgi:hypothetical protein